MATALDFLRIAFAPVLTASLERPMKLLQTPLSGLPGGLSEKRGPGLRRSGRDLLVGARVDCRGAAAGAAGVL